MNIKILLEGKIKEPYFKLGIDEFKKRLTGYTSLKIIETDFLKGAISLYPVLVSIPSLIAM